MELAIQSFIRSEGLQAAVDKWSLKVSEDNGLVQLNYSMIDSPRGVQEVDECRGLILDSNDNWRVVAFPFYRFYNAGEGPAAKIGIRTSAMLEKLDGTLIILYWHPRLKKIAAATRGRMLADGAVNSAFGALGNERPKTFAELFWDTMKKYPEALHELQNKDHEHTTLCLELFGPDNRVLTPYNESDVRLLMMRCNDTLREAPEADLDRWVSETGLKRPKRYSLTTHQDAEKMLSELNPTDEGFVLTDYGHEENGSFPRVKVKNPRYLALHHMIGAGQANAMSSERIATLIRSGDADEVIAYFPEHEEKIRLMQTRFSTLAHEIDAEFARIKNLGDNRKEFAAQAKMFKIPAALFMLLDKRISSGDEFISQMSDDCLMGVLKKGERA